MYIICLLLCLFSALSYGVGALQIPININPFTAPSCKLSGLKDERKRPQNGIFSGLITNLFSVLCVSMKILSHASAKKKTKRLKDVKFPTFIGLFK